MQTLSPRDQDQLRTMAAVIYDVQRRDCRDIRTLLVRDDDPAYTVEAARTVVASMVILADCLNASGDVVDEGRTIITGPAPEAPGPADVESYYKAAHGAAHVIAALNERRHGPARAVALAHSQVTRFARGDFGAGAVIE